VDVHRARSSNRTWCRTRTSTLVGLEEALERANVVLVLTDHKQFRRIDREVLHEKMLIDTRGIFL
jgi:UDP-N-acetyl-D-mannosaminuronate dehydrogenase